MYAKLNPYLTCIQVDNPNGYYTNWQTDNIANFSNNCSLAINDSDIKDVKIYPNPVASILHFTQNANIQIYNALGQRLAEQRGTKSVNMSGLRNGLYFIILTDDKERILLRRTVIKE